MIKTITRESIGTKLFEELIDDCLEFSRKDYYRSITFFVTEIFQLDEDNFPDNPELWGYWESNAVTCYDYWGFNNIDIYKLTRVEKKSKTIVIEEWVPVE